MEFFVVEELKPWRGSKKLGLWRNVADLIGGGESSDERKKVVVKMEGESGSAGKWGDGLNLISSHFSSSGL